MGVIKILLRIIFIISMVATAVTGNIIAAVVALGTACFNLGMLCGEKFKK